MGNILLFIQENVTRNYFRFLFTSKHFLEFQMTFRVTFEIKLSFELLQYARNTKSQRNCKFSANFEEYYF